MTLSVHGVLLGRHHREVPVLQVVFLAGIHGLGDHGVVVMDVFVFPLGDGPSVLAGGLVLRGQVRDLADQRGDVILGEELGRVHSVDVPASCSSGDDSINQFDERVKIHFFAEMSLAGLALLFGDALLSGRAKQGHHSILERYHCGAGRGLRVTQDVV